jgi:serine O-acetyltransferase
MNLKQVLYADLSRQYIIAGAPDKKPSILNFLRASLSPRFMPIVIFRLSHWLYMHRISPLAKVLSLVNFIFFGLEIAVKCEIGGGLYLPHTQGTVIGANKIGINATIYHGVTFGAREIDLSYTASSRPSVGDNVIVGAGAKVLGDVFLGNNSRVGANAVVLEDVPEGATVTGIPAKIIKQSSSS